LGICKRQGDEHIEGQTALATVGTRGAVFFSDRPDRIAGNMTTFIPFWSKGKDNFASNPPNADISILEGSELR
jgi:hypothetical protein